MKNFTRQSKLLFLFIIFTLLLANVCNSIQLNENFSERIINNSLRRETEIQLIWGEVYQAPYVEEGKSIIKCPGGYAIAGWTNSSGAGDLDVFVMRIADDGTQLWNVTIGNVEEDKGFQIINLQSGGFAIVSTYTNTSALHTNADLMLTKIASNGTVLWNKYYSGPDQDDITSVTGDYGRSIVQCVNNDIAIAGVVTRSAGGCDVVLIRVRSSDGLKIWERTYDRWDIDRCFTPYSLVECASGGFAIVGYTYNETQSNDVWLIKIDEFGFHEWNKTYGDSGGYQRPEGLVECSDGGFAIIANTHTFCLGDADAWIIRTDDLGNQLWNQTYGGEGSDGGGFITELVSEDLVFSGTTHSFDVGNGDVWLVRTAYNGTTIWNHTLGDEFGNSGGPFVFEGNDTYTVLGGTRVVEEAFADLWIFQVQIVTYYINETEPTPTPTPSPTSTESTAFTDTGSISLFVISEFLIVVLLIARIKKRMNN